MSDNPKFVINKVEYGFEDITLRKYLVLQELLRMETPDAQFQVAELVTGAPKELLKQLKYQEWLLVWLNTEKTISAMHEGTEKISPIIEFQGIEYGLPSIEDMSAGEFIDLDIIFQSTNAEKRLNEIAAIVYRPIMGKKGNHLILEAYDSKDSAIRAELFMDLPVKWIKSANSFFSQSADSLLKNTLGSLELTSLWTEISPEDQEKLQSLLQQDLGGSSSTKFLEKILSSLIQSQDSPSDTSSTGWLGKKMKSVKQIWKRKNYIVKA